MARMPGQGVAASIGGPTTPGTATVEVQEQGVPPPLPPPGLHPPDFSNWSLPFPEAPLTGGLSTPSGGLPSIGRQTAGPRASGQKASTPPTQASSAPQGMLPVHQPTSLLPHISRQPSHRTSLLPHISKQHSHRANPLLLMSRQCSHRASLLHRTNRLCSHPGGQQEGDCWPDLPQMEPLLHPTKPFLTVEGNRPGDGASEADQPVAPEEAEG